MLFERPVSLATTGISLAIMIPEFSNTTGTTKPGSWHGTDRELQSVPSAFIWVAQLQVRTTKRLDAPFASLCGDSWD